MKKQSYSKGVQSSIGLTDAKESTLYAICDMTIDAGDEDIQNTGTAPADLSLVLRRAGGLCVR